MSKHSNSMGMRYLGQSDEKMFTLIEKYGPCDLHRRRSDPFTELVHSIVGQQLSLSAGEAISQRLERKLDCPASDWPSQLLCISELELRSCGLSASKAGFLKNLANACQSGTLKLSALFEKPNEEVIRELTAIKGIGMWTAEMFLIFALRRADVYSTADGALKRAFCAIYNCDPENYLKTNQYVTGHWKPYRSIASWYLWRSLD